MKLWCRCSWHILRNSCEIYSISIRSYQNILVSFTCFQENLQLCVSALKTIALRTPATSCKWLLDAGTLPVFDAAMRFASHGEDIVRTSARAALLHMLKTLRKQDELQIALRMMSETLLGRAVFLTFGLVMLDVCCRIAKECHAFDAF